MLERDGKGKFLKRDLPLEVKQNRSCDDDKLSIIQWQLGSTQKQLEIWQREYASCDHKDRDAFRELVNHYAWRVAQWQEMLIECLYDCCSSDAKKDPT